MSFKFILSLLFASLFISVSYKGLFNLYDTFQKKTIATQICQASEARLQVGATREVVDIIHSSLLNAGYLTAEMELKLSDRVYAETKLNSENSLVVKCNPEGIKGVELSILFPINSFLTLDLILVFIASFIIFWIIKIFLVISGKGLLVGFENEFNKMLSHSIGIKINEHKSTPFWMKWLHKLSPTSLNEFKLRLSSLEQKIEQQSKDLQSQAIEKAVKESQLAEARKFKDLVHQVRHDLKQTLGVVRYSQELIPVTTTGRDTLKGAINTLQIMIEDLKEREMKQNSTSQFQTDLIEVIISEVVNEQRFAIPREKAEIKFAIKEKNLHLVAAPREELKRVLINLVVNASEAISDNGIIEIEVQSIDLERISIKIIDNGSGFSEEALKNLFKKGFTTKPEGSGRGLSFAQKKIREWGGSLFVESCPGKTMIEITLPSSQAEYWASPVILNEASSLTLVDDYPLDLSSILSQAVQLRTFNTLLSFEHAYRKGNINPNSLIIFDLHLEAGRLGLEALPLIKPEQKFIFMTSDHFNPALMSEAQKRGFVVIPKELLNFTSINRVNKIRSLKTIETLKYQIL